MKRLRIENYQSHTYTELEFHPGINVIVGRSQKGKTAIIRALKWLAVNRPSGFRFHTAGAENPTRVELEQDDRTVIVHEKSSKKESYKMGDRVWDKVNRDVPEEVRIKLNFDPINIQNQLDTPYLVTSSPGEIAREINTVIRIEEVYDWISRLTREINTANNSLITRTKDLESVEASLEKYTKLDKLKRPIKRLSLLQEGINRQHQERQELERLVGDYDRVSRKLVIKDRIERVDSILGEVSGLMNDIENSARMLIVLQKAVKLNRVVRLVSPKVKAVIDTIVRFEQVCLDIRGLTDLSDDITKCLLAENKLNHDKEELSNAKIQFGRALTEARRCPTCGKNISKDEVERIVEEL